MNTRYLAALISLACIPHAPAELKTQKDDKGIVFTTRNENTTSMASTVEASGKISQSFYFKGYWIATIIGWTDAALKQKPKECLFQRRMIGGRTNKDEPLGVAYAFLRRGMDREVFHISHDGEIIDAYFISPNNELTALTDKEFTDYRAERDASRE